MKHRIMFGYCLGVKCVRFHEMEFVKVICETTGNNEVLMSACLIWELETGRPFLHADLLCLVLKVNTVCVCVILSSTILLSVFSSSFLPCVVFLCLTFLLNSIFLNTEKKITS